MALPHTFGDQAGPTIDLSQLDDNFNYLLSLGGGILPIVPINTTSYTVTLADHGRILSFTSNSPVVVTYPSTLPSGHYAQLSQEGNGQVSVSSSMTNINRTGAYRTLGKGAVIAVQCWASGGQYKVLGDAY